MAANTFSNDQHKDLKADFIMANPPFNQKEWRADNELIDDPRWNGYEVPPTSNANYGWILNIVSKLSQNGVAGFLLANGALSDDGTELKVRKQLIENNLVEAIVISSSQLVLYHRHQCNALDPEQEQEGSCRRAERADETLPQQRKGNPLHGLAADGQPV
jgi:type I restriction-modification system DNA methylase subunit